MAAEARYNDAKAKFEKAVSHAEDQLANATDEYKEQKDMGITDKPFQDWVAQNYPVLQAAMSEYSATEGAYRMAYQQYDEAGFQEYQKKGTDEYNKLQFGDDEIKKSFKIINPQ
ncbi:hypothetical protein AA313_de0203966 [Arthrobotrys entomopaga]|nr:hypothetical protein AA313_de0203966 [Arthrobotrys entomopaga]